MPRPPASELQRTYAATVTQSGANVTVTLSGADFAIQNGLGNQFFGNIGNGYVNFSLRNTGGDYYYTVNTVGRPDVVERVSSGHLLAIWGYVYALASPGGFDAQLWGGFLVRSRVKWIAGEARDLVLLGSQPVPAHAREQRDAAPTLGSSCRRPMRAADCGQNAATRSTSQKLARAPMA
jgi:hypothetical protein